MPQNASNKVAMTTISGVAQAGPVKGEVSVYKLLEGGKRGEKLGETPSTDSGHFSVQVPVTADPVILTVTGSYKDEATGELVDMKGQELAQVLARANSDQSTQITPMTTMVHDAIIQQLNQKGSDISAIGKSIDTKTAEVARLFGVPVEVLRVVPSKPEAATSASNEGQAAQLLIILSQAMKDAGLTSSKDINPIAAIKALSQEFASSGKIGESTTVNDHDSDSNVKEFMSSWSKNLVIAREKVFLDSKMEVPPSWILPKSDIKSANVAPSAFNQKIKVVGSAAIQAVKANDSNRDALRYSVVKQGAFGKFEFIDQFSGRFIYTPNNDADQGFAGYVTDDAFTYKVSDGELESDEATITIQRVPASGVLSGKCYQNGEVVSDLPNGTGYCAPTNEFWVENELKRGLDSFGTGSSGERRYFLGRLVTGLIDLKCYRDGLQVPDLDVDGSGYCDGNATYYIAGAPVKDLDAFGNGTLNGLTYRGGKKLTGFENKKCYSKGLDTASLDAQGNGSCNGRLFANWKTVNGLIGSDCYSNGEKTNSLTNATGWCHGLATDIIPNNFNPTLTDIRAFTIDKEGNAIVAGQHCVQKFIGEYSSKVIAGNCTVSGDLDATGVNARFNDITSVAIHSDGTIYVSDFGPTIKKITQDGLVRTIFVHADQNGEVLERGFDQIVITENKQIFGLRASWLYRINAMYEDRRPFWQIEDKRFGYLTSGRRVSLLKNGLVAVVSSDKLSTFDPTADKIVDYGYLDDRYVYNSWKNSSDRSYDAENYVFHVKDGLTAKIPNNLHRSVYWDYTLNPSSSDYAGWTLEDRKTVTSFVDQVKTNIAKIGSRADYANWPNKYIRFADDELYFLMTDGYKNLLKKLSEGSFYKNGIQVPTLDFTGSGIFNGARYWLGQVVTGFSNGTCYVNGKPDRLFESSNIGQCENLFYNSGNLANGILEGAEYKNGVKSGNYGFQVGGGTSYSPSCTSNCNFVDVLFHNDSRCAKDGDCTFEIYVEGNRVNISKPPTNSLRFWVGPRLCSYYPCNEARFTAYITTLIKATGEKFESNFDVTVYKR